MIYLVEKLNSENRPTLGTDGRYIFRRYQTLKAVERYQIRHLVKQHGKVWLSEYTGDNIYGKPVKVWQYENSDTNSKGFWKCIIWKQ
jgi:hypothetical protein